MKTFDDFKKWYLETPINEAQRLEDIYAFFKQDEFIALQFSIKDIWPDSDAIDAAFWESFDEDKFDGQEDAWNQGVDWVKEKLLEGL